MYRAPLGRALAAVVLALSCAGAAQAQSPAAPSPAAQRGLNFLRANCAQCHSIDRVTESPLKIAPPFRDLHRRYPIESLQEAFAEGIVTGHPTMPEFRLEPDQIANVLAYLKSLER